jgi:hypothetical protein
MPGVNNHEPTLLPYSFLKSRVIPKTKENIAAAAHVSIPPSPPPNRRIKRPFTVLSMI